MYPGSVHGSEASDQEANNHLHYLPDNEALERARNVRMKEIQLRLVFLEIVFYVIFLLLLLVVAYGQRDHYAFKQSDSLSNIFGFQVSLFHMVSFKIVSFPANYLVLLLLLNS